MGYQSVQDLLPHVLLVLGGDAPVPTLLNRRQPVLEGVHVARRTASPFDSTFSWNACHSYPESSLDDFRLFYQRHVRCSCGQNIRTSFGHVSKSQENSSS